MCTIGYHKKLNVVFKNRDKNLPTDEVIVVKPEFIAVKTEGADYYGLGANRHGCAFVSAAVNTPAWTALITAGKLKEAEAQSKKENDGLKNPMAVVSRYLAEIYDVEEWLEKLLNEKAKFMGYNIVLADADKAAAIEIYGKDHHLTWLKDYSVLTNHFHTLKHGPKTRKDYPSSFKRLEYANGEMRNIVSIEDLFGILKTHDRDPVSDLWRKGVFPTISSSVIDLEAPALYYSNTLDHDYTRVAADIPPKGAEKAFIEMSRYIDLPTYHNIERGHPFYVEMIETIQDEIKNYYKSVKKHADGGTGLSVLELGAGTGLCSLEIIKHPFLRLDALEIDSECCKILSSHPEASKYNVILGDAVAHCKKHYYDMVVSTFAHDHIHYNKRFAFSKNIHNNLKGGGIYIMGGELLPYFSNDLERKKALFKYHNYIIDEALKHNRVQIAELENNALKSGLDLVGDFKRHEKMFEQEMASADFRLKKKIKMGPHDVHDVGGVFVYVYETV